MDCRKRKIFRRSISDALLELYFSLVGTCIICKRKCTQGVPKVMRVTFFYSKIDFKEFSFYTI